MLCHQPMFHYLLDYEIIWSWASFARKKCWGRGGGVNLVIKIFGVTNCNPLPHKRFEDHCGSDFWFNSSYVYCSCSEYLNIGREWKHVVWISPVKMTVKRKFLSIPKMGGGGGGIKYSVPLTAKSGGTCPPCIPPPHHHHPPTPNDAHATRLNRKGRNVLFNDTLNTFYLLLYGASDIW